MAEPADRQGPEAPESMNAQIIRGSAWMVGMRWALRLIGLLSTVILARLLDPADYGVLGMAMLVVGFLNVFTFTSFDLALIQRIDAGRDHYDSAWTLQVIQGAVLGGLMALAAPFAAVYFQEPRVEIVIQILAVSALIDGFANIGTVAFRKELDFAKEFRFNTYVRVAAFVFTIGLAFYLRSYWALVAGIVATALLRVAASYTMHPYRPRFTLSRAHDIWSFSQWMLLFYVATYLRNRLDGFIVGRLAGTAGMGNYYIASELSAMPTNEVVMPIGRALFPSYARLASDPAAAAATFLRVMSLLLMLCLPLGFGLAAVAHDAVVVLLGENWRAAGALMQWLAIAATVNGLVHAVGVYLTACGRPRINAVLTWSAFLLLVPVLVFAGTTWGIEAIAAARAGVALAFLPLVMLAATRKGVLGPGDIAAVAWRPVAASLVMVAAILWLHGAAGGPPALRLCLDIATGSIVYLGVSVLLWRLSGCPDGAERDLISGASKVVDQLRR
ncbi:MAG: oligosaccharide flippase family protein [Alphaproteobacteria bacterium]|nr:oligosaccharide flippase family protein [Alphaproteobacteria bacterium]